MGNFAAKPKAPEKVTFEPTDDPEFTMITLEDDKGNQTFARVSAQRLFQWQLENAGKEEVEKMINLAELVESTNGVQKRRVVPAASTPEPPNSGA